MFRKKNLLSSSFFNLILFILLVLLPALDCPACFSIVVGKDASADGCVLVAHNEDDSPPQIVNHYKIPRKKYKAGQEIEKLNNRKAPQNSQTWACIWSEMPGTDYSDSFVNEWGLCITSNSCPSKEDKPEITDGGIGKMLRRQIALNSKSARQGVLLAGKLVEKYGYLDSGRTYIIADSNEGWLFCAVNGKHWLAQRVPDNHVAMVPNTYTIRKVTLADKQNFLASSDIIDYAISRGWFSPDSNSLFDFAKVYANPTDATSPTNFGRQWAGLKHITNKNILLNSDLPFSIEPEQKISLPVLMEILRFDNETSKPQFTQTCTEEQLNTCIICRGSTQTSFIAQLRNDLPSDIGIVYWLCLSQPSRSFYIPFYFGIDKFPQGYCLESKRPTKKEFEQKMNAPFKPDPTEAFWTFSNFSKKIYDSHADKLQLARDKFSQIEQTAIKLQKPIEKSAIQLYRNDKQAAIQLLKNYSRGIYLSAIEAMQDSLKLK